MADVVVTHNPDQSRYEADVDGRAAGFLSTQGTGDVVTLPHTEVFSDFEGQGVGSALTRYALDDLRQQGKKVNPTCPFVRTWIERHADYADMVA